MEGDYMDNLALKQELRNRLHISNSGIKTYLMCSQRFNFQYCLGLPQERQSINLVFGSALHALLDRAFCTLKNTGEHEDVETLCDALKDYLETSIADTKVPWVFNSTIPDLETAKSLGVGMLAVALDNAKSVQPEQIYGVEVPLAMPLYDSNENSLDIDLIGFVDLILRDDAGNLIIVDHKSAKNKISQSQADIDYQMSCYASLFEANGMISATDNITCRFEIMRKTKRPAFEQVETVRTPHHRKQFLNVVQKVLLGIENQVFMPNPGWACGDCPWKDACQE
jgi:putative RecB family exonuclease